MIRTIHMTADGCLMMAVGLDEKDIEALKSGQTLRAAAFSLEAPWNGEVAFYYGPTEENLKEQLKAAPPDKLRPS